jgi:hypothetical protein
MLGHFDPPNPLDLNKTLTPWSRPLAENPASAARSSLPISGIHFYAFPADSFIFVQS